MEANRAPETREWAGAFFFSCSMGVYGVLRRETGREVNGNATRKSHFLASPEGLTHRGAFYTFCRNKEFCFITVIGYSDECVGPLFRMHESVSQIVPQTVVKMCQCISHHLQSRHNSGEYCDGTFIVWVVRFANSLCAISKWVFDTLVTWIDLFMQVV